MFKTSNRPISPHITIYLPQSTSLFSIWHRISGFILVSGLFFSLFFLKLISWWLSFSTHNLSFSTFSICFLFSVYLISFLYHLSNGLRHILWDFDLLLTTNQAFNSGVAIIIFVISLQTSLLKIFIY